MSDEDRFPTRGSRRSFLAASATVSGGLVGVAGCLATAGRVRVLAATSLTVALEERLGPAFESATGIRFDGEYHGTNAILRMIEEGRAHPDVIVGVDVSLLRDRLYPDFVDWDVEFATNEMVIAYAADTELGARLESDEPWYDVLADAEEGAIGISDPDRSPVGYRALQLFELAEREHDLEGFYDATVERVQVDAGEGQVLGGVDAGTRSCAVVYRNMAADRDLPVRELPDAYNFGDPDTEYARASYTTTEGRTIAGSPIVYNASVRNGADGEDGGERFVSHLLENPDGLEKSGLRTPTPLPRGHGDVPGRVLP
ncbi:extracellular solute-binding protein [Natrarchaeobius chitinivorans]|uniref:Sulfate ABC transporter substrate-binding protein n=1 Tax=Natrarchaeobius chitinivorans TaxID=1679083 RepID=A0A3N6MII9_NATCH|nr:extracellular solute-binding protein [Natrarchaeobius chitinivorans]RQG93866.1 sulfate ABC transporter substrate-binding protein [Natrarchaeobius chitinivorans]